MPAARWPLDASRRTDADLTLAARAGDAEALGALYRRYGDALMAVAFRLLYSVPDAEDVLHDVFVGLPEALRRYEERGALEPWLKRVTARVALSRLRSDRGAHQVDVDDVQLAARAEDREMALSLAT